VRFGGASPPSLLDHVSFGWQAAQDGAKII
jgi:hypothetical protein